MKSVMIMGIGVLSLTLFSFTNFNPDLGSGKVVKMETLR